MCSQRPRSPREAARLTTQYQDLVKSGGSSIYRREDRFSQQPRMNGKPSAAYGSDNQQHWTKGQDYHKSKGGSSQVSGPGIVRAGTNLGRQEHGSGNIGCNPNPILFALVVGSLVTLATEPG